MRKLILTLIVALFAAFSVSAQTTYSSADYGTVGDSLFYTKVTLNPSQVYYFFQAGTNQTWNYSTYTPTTQYYQDYLSPATAGYRPTFLADCVGAGGTPAGCRNQFNTLTNLALPTTDINVSTYTFTNVVAHDDLSAGSLETNIIGMTARINGINVPFTFTYSSPDVVYVFPIAYGSRDSSVSGYVINLNSQGINFAYHVHSKRVNHDDAWGTLTTPYTTYASTVRQRSTILHTDTLFYNNSVLPVAPYTDVVYSWFTPTKTGPVFIAHGTIGAGGQENFSRIEYLDTIHCLVPNAIARYNPGLPIINALGSVAVNFNNASTNANSYEWSFGDAGSGALNTSTSQNSTHTYNAAGTYNCELIACNTVCQPAKCDTEKFNVTVVDSGQVHAGFIAIPSLTCVNDSVHFHDNSTNATSYSWNFGDNTTSTLQTPTHVYTTSGVFNVVLVARGSGGTTDTARRTVTIQPPPSATITPNGPTSFCNGDSVILVASGGTVYHWSDGSVADKLTVRRSGTFTLTAENTCGTAVSAPITITVTTPIDTITAAGTLTFCNGDSVRLQANTGAGLTYQWKRNGQVIINATLNSYEAKVTGNYTVNVTQNGCRGLSNIIAVTVNPIPNPTVSVQSSTVICSGDSLKLTAPNVATNTYQWLRNGSNIAGATNNIYYAKTAGTYTVFVTRNGCSATSNGIAVTVNPTPAPTISIASANTLCAGDSLLLTTQSGAGYVYQWKLNGINITGATSETYYAKSQGVYSVEVTASGCIGTSPTQSVIVHARPTANAGQGVTHSLTACSFATTTIGGSPSASGGTTPYTYSWSPASGLSSPTAADPTVSHLGTSQLYTLLVTDSNGCTATDTTTVHVSGSSLVATIGTTGSTSWCYGSAGSVILDATVTGGTGSYLYNWTPSTYLSSSSTVQTTATPVPVGSYTYSLLVTDGNGCQAGASVTVTVNPQPIATVTANDTTAPCSGDSVHFSAGAGTGYSYQWLDNGSSITGATNINFATGVAGSYSVSVSDGTCSATSGATTVTVRTTPSATITPQGSLSYCVGSTVTLDAPTGTGYSYQWYENAQTISGATAATYAAADSASYYVEVIANGCSAISPAVNTTVNQYPADSISANGSTAFCAGNTVQLSASTGIGYTYTWQNNGVAIAGQTGATITADSTGTYNVIVSALGCNSSSLGIPVTVYQYPNSGISALGSTTFCGGDSVTLSAPSDSGYTYQWQNDGNDVSGAVSMNLTTMDSGQYTVIITQNGCTVVSNDLYVNVLPLPAAAAYVNGTGLVCPSDSFYLYVAASPGSTYQWQLAGNNISGATTDTIYTNVIGAYDVLVTGGGCTGTSNIVVVGNYPTQAPVITQAGPSIGVASGIAFQWYAGTTLIAGATQQSYSPPATGTYSVYVTDSNGCSQLSAPFSFAPNGIGNVTDLAQVTVYPNPAHESIAVAINTTTESNLTIQLYDMIGNEVGVGSSGTQGAGSAVHQLSVAGFAAGIYVVKISDGSSTIARRISVQ